ncbi:MAG: hypothetical protein Q4B68_01765 [Bacteroidales bacterium]|nr:hypothetical protein [Bacteroidales bacterium]
MTDKTTAAETNHTGQQPRNPILDLADKFCEITEVYVPIKYFYVREGKLVIAPYGSPGIEFDQDGDWEINKGEILHISFLHELYDVMNAFGEVVRNTDLSSLKEANTEEETEEDLMEEAIKEWELREEEMRMVTSYLSMYHSGMIAPSSRVLNQYMEALHILTHLFTHGQYPTIPEPEQVTTTVQPQNTPSKTHIEESNEEIELPF